MIEKASEIREQFIAKEAQRVEGIKMPHMPTLGSAYEEITRQGIDFNLVLSKGVPTGHETRKCPKASYNQT